MRQVNSAILNRYSRLYQKNPQSRIFAPLADLYRQKGDVKKALTICQKGIKQHPHFAPGFVVLAMIWQELNNPELAIQALETATDLSPNNLLAHKLLGQLWLKLRNPAKTLSAYKMVLFLDPENKKAQHIVKKLETITATQYDDTGFAFKNLQDIAQYLEPADPANPPTLHPLPRVLESKDKQQFEDRLAIVEALIYRKNFKKARLFLMEMTNIYNAHSECQKSILSLQKKIPLDASDSVEPDDFPLTATMSRVEFQKTHVSYPMKSKSYQTSVLPSAPQSPKSDKVKTDIISLKPGTFPKNLESLVRQRQITKLRQLLSQLEKIV